MALKDLLLDYTGTPACNNALDFALQLAQSFESAVTGLHVKDVEVYEGQINRFIPADALDVIRRGQDEAVEKVTASFWEEVDRLKADRDRIEWMVADGRPDAVLAKYARYHDILIMGRVRERSVTSTYEAHFADIVVRSGKPVILVPEDYKMKPFSGTAVVAWDGSRAAARSLSDAMQILEIEKQIDVLTVGDRVTPKNEARSIIHLLERHGIPSERVFKPEDHGGKAQTILDYCHDVKPDLLVMGARGQSRLRDFVLGSTTDEILRKSEVPILISY